MIEANFKKFLTTVFFSSRNFTNKMNKPGLHFDNLNSKDNYINNKDKDADKKDSGKNKWVCSIDFLPATEVSRNTHED